MNKRGISPLIISVILVGFVVVIGSFVFFWTSGLTKGEMEKQSFEFEILDYGARASPSQGADCPSWCSYLQSSILPLYLSHLIIEMEILFFI